MTAIAMSIFDDVDNPHYGGGGARVVHEIARQLVKDYSVTVYSASYRGSLSQVRDGVQYVFLPVGWAGPRGGQLLFNLILPLVALLRPPAAWIESLTPPFTASVLPVVSRAPVVGLVQMLSAADMARKYHVPFTVVERRGLRLYRHFVTLNEVDRDTVHACNPATVPVLIPNGVARPVVADREFGRGEFILFLGRIDVEQKGLDLLLRAVALDPPDLPVVIAGSGTRVEERKLRDMLEHHDGDVRLVGRVGGRQKTDLLRRCAVVVLPSRYETFPLTVLEAMAYGKPVACFDLPRLSWIDPGCAVRVPAFDVAQLGRAVRELSVDPDRRAALGRRGHAVSEAYAWDAIGGQYRDLVAGVIAGDAKCSQRRR